MIATKAVATIIVARAASCYHQQSLLKPNLEKMGRSVGAHGTPALLYGESSETLIVDVCVGSFANSVKTHPKAKENTSSNTLATPRTRLNTIEDPPKSNVL